MRLIFWIGFGLALLLFLTVIELSRRQILDRQSFFIGMTLTIALGIFSLIPDALRGFTRLLGLEYTYVLTSTAGILGLLVLNIYTLSKVSAQNKRLNDLAQEMALDDS